LIALAVIAAGLFFARRQIGDALARKLDEQLVASGIFVDWKSAAWVPGPGIRLRDLALYRDSAKHDRLALLSSVKAIKGDRDWSRWDTLGVEVDDANLTLEIGAGETKLEHLQLRLKIEPGRVSLRECRAGLFGLQLDSKGDYGLAPVTPAANAQTPAANAQTPAKPVPNKDRGILADVDLSWLASLKEWLAFKAEKSAPVLKVEFHSRPGGGMDVASSLDGRKFEWRGQQWDLIDTAVKASVGDSPSPVEIEHFRLGCSGQTAELAARYDTAQGVIRISQLDSGIDVLALVRALVPGAATNLVAVTTAGNWRLNGEGEIPLGHPEKTAWNGRLSLDGEVAYASSGTSLKIQKPAFEFRMNDAVLTISNLKAGLWEGNLDAPNTQIQLAPSPDAKPKFTAQWTLNNARLQSIMNSFGTSQKQPGMVQVSWKGGGGFDLNSITGSGSLGIHQAEFYRIPLLGPLHLVFDKLAPGFGKDVASTLTANHRLGGGNLQINKLRLESKLTRIEADGVVDLNKQYAHLVAQAKLQGIAGMATILLSTLLQMEGDGPVSDVHWKLNMPADLIGGAANVVGKAGGAVIEGAGGAVKETGKAAKGLLKIPGKIFGK
jgi:hypothetical protein